MKKLSLLILLLTSLCLLTLVSCGSDDKDEPNPNPPTTETTEDWGSIKNNGYAGTGAAVNITKQRATIQCSINKDFGPAYLFVTINLSTSPNFDEDPSVDAIESSGIINGDKYRVFLYGLKANTKYYYKSYVKVGAMTYEGDVRSFTTMDYKILTSGYMDFGEQCGKWAACNVGATNPSQKGSLYPFFPWDVIGQKSPFFTSDGHDYLKWAYTSDDPATQANSNTYTPSYDYIYAYGMRRFLGENYIEPYTYKGIKGIIVTLPANDGKEPQDEVIFLPAGTYLTEGYASSGVSSADTAIKYSYFIIDEFGNINEDWFYLLLDDNYCVKAFSPAESKNIKGYIRPKYR